MYVTRPNMAVTSSARCRTSVTKPGLPLVVVAVILYGAGLMAYMKYDSMSPSPAVSGDTMGDTRLLYQITNINQTNVVKDLQRSAVSDSEASVNNAVKKITTINQPVKELADGRSQTTVSDVEESGTPPITRIIVVAYYRSGSTFVSDLLQLGNNSFHLCEPFYAIYAHWYGTVGYHEVLFKGDGTRRSLPAGETEKQVKMMDDMLACRFSRLPREFFISRFHWEYPTSSRTIGTAASPTAAATDNGDNGSTDTLKSPYMRCLAAANVTRLSHLNCFRGYPQVCTQKVFIGGSMVNMCYAAKNNLPGSSHALRRYLSRYTNCVSAVWARMSHCTPLLEQECNAATTRVIKTIRLDLDTVDRVVDRNPDVKVIHLVRDPRAMLNSRRKWVPVSRPEIAATCARMRADFDTFQRLTSTSGSGRQSTYILARYENVISDPTTSAARVYSHVRLKPPSQFAQWLANHTQAKRDNAPEGTVRRNSTAHISAWKATKGLSAIFARFAPPSCFELLDELRYDRA